MKSQYMGTLTMTEFLTRMRRTTSFELQVQRPARGLPTLGNRVRGTAYVSPVFDLKPLTRGPMGKVPEGLPSRNECIELLPRQAVHDSPNVFVEIGLPHFVPPDASVPLC